MYFAWEKKQPVDKWLALGNDFDLKALAQGCLPKEHSALSPIFETEVLLSLTVEGVVLNYPAQLD